MAAILEESDFHERRLGDEQLVPLRQALSQGGSLDSTE
jgi:hypothetical protein